MARYETVCLVFGGGTYIRDLKVNDLIRHRDNRPRCFTAKTAREWIAKAEARDR